MAAVTNGLPYMPLWVKDLLSDTNWRGMESYDRGMYMTLLAVQWNEKGKGLPDDENLLWANSDCTYPMDSTEWERFYGHWVMLLFPAGQDGKRRNPRCHEEWCKVMVAQRGRSIGGKRGAETRRQQQDSKTL